jgi:glutamate/tyrosine decarboxylase-like PLP-dependent enzyme
VELTVIKWLCELCGLPADAGGLFVSGGTMANLTALVVARRQKFAGSLENATVYFSDQVHSSFEKALRVIGLPPANVNKLAADTSFRLPVNELSRRIEHDRVSGKQPFCVIASAGTTNTGAIDPLPEISRLCREQNLWLHVDGAYGAAAVIAPRGRDLLNGLELADSLSLDPHKWLFQPYETGCLLVRDQNHLTDAFRILPEYLKDTQLKSEEINFTDYGIQLTRSFRALKLWMSIKVFGMAAFRAAVEHGFVLAELTEAGLRRMPGWEVVTPAQMGIVCFRHRDLDDNGHLSLVQTLLQDGFALITSTVLNKRTVLRTCTINPRTTEADIRQTLQKLDGLARKAAKA